MTARGTGLVVSVVTVVTLVAGGYAWSDAADLVPGRLTTRPPVAPPAPLAAEPVVRVPAELLDVAGPLVPAVPDDLGAGEPADAAEPVDAATLATVLAPLLADPALGPAPR